MNRFRRWRAWLMAGVACLAVPLACSAPGKGALILAISTDMQAQKDTDVVSVYIATNARTP